MWEELEKADNALRNSNKKGWTILSFRDIHTKEIHTRWVSKFTPTPMYGKNEPYETQQWYLDYPNFNKEDNLPHDYEIYSVRRESDGKVFTVGNKYQLRSGETTTITGFTVIDDEILLNTYHNITILFDNWTPPILEEKQPVLMGKDSYLVVGSRIPCAIVDERNNLESIWLFNEEKQAYISHISGKPEIIDDLKVFEQGCFRPFYNTQQVDAYLNAHGSELVEHYKHQIEYNEHTDTH